MTRAVQCDCGWSYTGEEDDLVAAVQEHARTVHDMTVTREQALELSQPAEG